MNNRKRAILKRHSLMLASIKDVADKLLIVHQVFEFTQTYIYDELSKLKRTSNQEIDLDEEDDFELELLIQAAPNLLNLIKSKWTDVRIFLDLIDNLREDIQEITIAVEDNYIDRDYRDSYYMHYSEEHSETCRFCSRLLFFNGNYYNELDKVRISQRTFKKLERAFIGSMVIRPIVGCAIGRTLISPFFLSSLNNSYIRWTEYTIYYRGYRFIIKAFPFRMQDMVTTTCAEITLMNIFDYYSKQYVDYKYLLPSDIYQICKRQHNDRVIPTEGISYDVISRIFYESGFAPKLYIISNKKKKNVFNNVRPIEMLDYYVESGMPVAVGLDYGTIGHSIVCIGHGACTYNLSEVTPENTRPMKDDGIFYINSANLHKEYIFQDDSEMPYITRKKSEEDKDALIIGSSSPKNIKVNCIVAPLYRRMYMDANAAKKVVLSILRHPTYTPYPIKISDDRSKPGQTADNPIVFRLFLASSRHFKESRLKSINDNWLYDLHQEIPLPNFIWVCELYSKQGYIDKKPFGEIVLDATSPAQENSFDSCLLICYPERVIAKSFDGQSLLMENSEAMDWAETPATANCSSLFSSYKENLHLIKLYP